MGTGLMSLWTLSQPLGRSRMPGPRPSTQLQNKHLERLSALALHRHHLSPTNSLMKGAPLYPSSQRTPGLPDAQTPSAQLRAHAHAPHQPPTFTDQGSPDLQLMPLALSHLLRADVTQRAVDLKIIHISK